MGREDKMSEFHWDTKEVKRLKKKHLIQSNLAILLFFVLFGYLAEKGAIFVLYGLICLFLWISVVATLYNLNTGKLVSTKTSKRVQEYDIHRLGEKRWKRRILISAVILIVVSIAFTVFLFVADLEAVRIDFPALVFSFIGTCIGYNIAGIFEISSLEGSDE